MLKNLFFGFFASFLLIIQAGAGVAASQPYSLPADVVTQIDSLAERTIAQKNAAGIMVLAGYRGQVIFRKAYGYRSLIPLRQPMTTDTVFDMASLTKVVVTAPLVLQLLDQGKLKLEDPMALYLSPFRAADKKGITIRQCLTHYAGLPPDLDKKDLKYTARSKPSARTTWRKIWQIKPEAAPGERFRYSDIGFLALGRLVEKVTGESLDQLARERIFSPLKMNSSRYRPPSSWRNQIAATEKLPWGEVLKGRVHDPTAYLLGGVAGHAGLFSTAVDLSRFCQMILNEGNLDGIQLLQSATVRRMTSPQSPGGKDDLRGLGWDIQTAYSSPRGDYFSPQSFGHTGYTGTSIWIDPVCQTYLIILSNRVHPEDKGSSKELRMGIADLVGAAVMKTTSGF